MELGLGFISWLFGGWHPEPIAHTKHKGDPDFSQGQMWMPWHQRGATKQHRGTAYSMRLEQIEKIMDQASWEGQPVDSKPGLVCKKLLHAPSFGPGKCARISRGITAINGDYGWDEGAWYALHFYSMPLAISFVSGLHFLVVSLYLPVDVLGPKSARSTGSTSACCPSNMLTSIGTRNQRTRSSLSPVPTGPSTRQHGSWIFSLEYDILNTTK